MRIVQGQSRVTGASAASAAVDPPRRHGSLRRGAGAGEREVKCRRKTDCRNSTKNGVIHTFRSCIIFKLMTLKCFENIGPEAPRTASMS